jgi:hypothetical protein
LSIEELRDTILVRERERERETEREREREREREGDRIFRTNLHMDKNLGLI